MSYGLPGKADYGYERPFDYFNFELAADTNNGCNNAPAPGPAQPQIVTLKVKRLMSMPVHDPSPLTAEQRRAITALLAAIPKVADELGRLFARNGHELALVGGPVRDIFLRRSVSDLDLTTDASPERVMGAGFSATSKRACFA